MIPTLRTWVFLVGSCCIDGAVYGHPSRPDGTRITTSIVQYLRGNVITTFSGSVYELDFATPENTEWRSLVAVMSLNGKYLLQ